jgi:hypothetical protein
VIAWQFWTHEGEMFGVHAGSAGLG